MSKDDYSNKKMQIPVGLGLQWQNCKFERKTSSQIAGFDGQT